MKKIPGIVISRIIGLMIFLLLLFLINWLPISNRIYIMLVEFFNINAVLIVIMSLLFMIGEVFYELFFPLNLGSPFFSALAAILLVKFIVRIFALLDRLLDLNIIRVFEPLGILLYPLVFIAVLIGGYISIFSRLAKKEKVKKTTKKTEKKSKDTTWEEVGEEFRETLSDFFKYLKKKFNE